MKDIEKKKLLRQFLSESQSDMVLNAEKDAAFNVSLGKLTVGTLLYSGGVWQFSYSEEFKQQSRIVPLSNFPAKDKTYRDSELWPFFASRIPSSSQLQLDKDAPREDLVTLLRKFGRRTITTPFEVVPVT